MIELVADTAAIDFRSLRFLIVDDERDQRFLLAKTLAGMEVAERDSVGFFTRFARALGLSATPA